MAQTHAVLVHGMDKIFGVAALFSMAAFTMVGLRVRLVPVARPVARPAIARQLAAAGDPDEFGEFEGDEALAEYSIPKAG